jgi:hypothetical protein
MSMVHPGYNLLAEGWADMADEPLRIVQRTAQGLGLPLRSLEIELGPSQVEAVFEPSDALTAADRMVLFRNGVRQALRRAGYHASFVCRPPFPNVMASGWHLHQSLVALDGDGNAFVRAAAAAGSAVLVATHDPEFAALAAERVVLLADGRVIADGRAAELLSGGWYFATETARIVDGALLPEDGAELLRARMTIMARP